MATRLRANLPVLVRSGSIHILLIIAIALLFYGVESIIEFFLRDIDNIIDIVMAIASTFVLLWLRSAMENARLSEMLRVQSEARTKELERRITEIAHEFQTPLAILKSNVATLAKSTGTSGGNGSGAQKKNANRGERVNAAYIATATLDRLSRLVVNLLDIAKLNFSKDMLIRQAVDVTMLIEDAREDCAILAEDNNVAISTAITAVDMNGTIVVGGDKDKLKEVLLNLLSNALKHTPPGGAISIAAGVVGAAGGDNDCREVEIIVADTGTGIPPEKLPHIFERFYRIENPSGNGLGLHICRQIVEAHGGTITAESEPGRGSRFIIRLPITAASTTVPTTATRPGSGIIKKCKQLLS
jgi:signal transduction histidine kinase